MQPPARPRTPQPPHDALNHQLLLTLMQEFSRDAVLALDPEGRITFWNQGAEDLLGYRADEVLGRHFEFMIPHDLRELGEVERLLRETEKEGYLRDYETRRLTRDGQEIHVSLVRMRLCDEDGRILGAAAILSDITEQKRMGDELVRSRTLAAIGEFAARIAHEVKNPLTGISSALTIITDQLGSEHPQAELYEEIQDQIRRIDRIADDLLTFARQRPLSRQPTDLVQLLQKVLNLVEASGELGGIRVERPELTEYVVEADPSMLQDCFFNLLHNAAQSLKQKGGGTIAIAVEPGPTGVRVRIQDDGPGIPPEVLEKIFDPFFTTKVRGTGLGLPITRKHVEAHGGTLQVRSEPHSQTTFEVYLPRDVIAASMSTDEGESERKS